MVEMNEKAECNYIIKMDSLLAALGRRFYVNGFWGFSLVLF